MKKISTLCLVLFCGFISGCDDPKDRISITNYDDDSIFVSFCADRHFEKRKGRKNVLCSGYYGLDLDESFYLEAEHSDQNLYLRVTRNGYPLDFNGTYEKQNFMTADNERFTVEQHPDSPRMLKLLWSRTFLVWGQKEINWISSNSVPEGWSYKEMIRSTDGNTSLEIFPE